MGFPKRVHSFHDRPSEWSLRVLRRAFIYHLGWRAGAYKYGGLEMQGLSFPLFCAILIPTLFANIYLHNHHQFNHLQLEALHKKQITNAEMSIARASRNVIKKVLAIEQSEVGDFASFCLRRFDGSTHLL